MTGLRPVGAFPQTPARPKGAALDHDGTPEPPRRSTGNNLPVAPQQQAAAPGASAPLIPLTYIDAPSQRLYALAIYAALFAWKFYDWVGLVEENSESFWLFLKWIGLDCAFLFMLPELRIPWLELSQPFVVALFFCHAIFDYMLMFNVGLPWQGLILGFVRVFYDRELAISEHNVKVSNILHNSSLIMGRQVINILPEGTAELNPEGASFCLGGDAHRKAVMLPMYFNATVPVEVELIRQDFDPEIAPEHIKLSRSQLREIERKAKSHSQDGAQAMVQFDLPVKKTGVYRLAKVLDEYKLEVHKRTPQTFVVTCPRAWVRPAHGSGRCTADLSDVTLQVEGTPPLRIVYSRTVNGKDEKRDLQSLQPDGFSSPLTGSLTSSAIVAPDGHDVSWARAQQIPIALNESMDTSGEWQYSIDKVTDGFGNEQEYASPIDDPEGKPKAKNLVQNFLVKERPQIRLEGCDLRNPLKVAKGESKELPVRFSISGRTPDDTAHSLTWQFSPIDTLTEAGDHGDVVSPGSYNARNARDRPRISASGLYTLRSVTAGSCEGEVQEPASCLLLNPLEPKLTIRSEEIPDTCAGNSVGLQVAMDFIGTPPFTVRYDMITYRGDHDRGDHETKRIQVPGLRYQMDLIPRVAGHHKYVFTHIDDDIYKGQKLTGPEFVLEQDVKPAAGAMIQHSATKVGACLGDKADVNVILVGDAPFTLEWEVIHDGKRKHQSASGIEDKTFKIQTTPLVQGGEYTIALKSVQDKRGCKNMLQDEIKVAVRMQSPRVAFGQLQHKRKTMAVEGSLVKLPVRLTGEGPWKVYYTNNDGDSTKESKVLEKTLRNDNDFLEVRGRGVFTITDVWDNQCHGIVDSKASTFQVEWYPRPQLSISPSQVISHTDDIYVLDPVCEGEVSRFEIDLKGTPPYNVKYDVVHTPLQGSSSPKYRKELDTQAARVSIPGDTAKAGIYKYKFSAVADNLYDHAANFQPLVVQQNVNKKPAAAFVKPGQTFKLCKTDEGETEGIPVTLSGVPPFSLDIEIKHHSAAAPEIYRTPSIKTNTYEIRIPKHHLRLGTQHIRIRDVKDGSGCHSVADLGSAGAVQVQLYEAPAIYALEQRTDYCVGERLSYTLSGTPPFEVWYTFDGTERKAKSPTTNFRRVAESPGEFTITTVSDKASECRAPVKIVKNIHPMPAVKISKGKNVQVDIHEGSEVEILFEFWGTPPFEWTYTRSTNARKGQKSQVLETRHDVSHEHSKVVRANQEGTYEVVAIKDKYCAFSTQTTESKGGKEQKARKYLQGA